MSLNMKCLRHKWHSILRCIYRGGGKGSLLNDCHKNCKRQSLNTSSYCSLSSNQINQVNKCCLILILNYKLEGPGTSNKKPLFKIQHFLHHFNFYGSSWSAAKSIKPAFKCTAMPKWFNNKF